MQQRTAHHRQQGAASIEFAAVFVLLFLMFYAMVGYSIPLLLSATYQEIAADALREAMLHPGGQAELEVTRLIADSWLPGNWVSVCDDYAGSYLNVADNTWSVCLRHEQPSSILPPLSLMGWQVPNLPNEIRGEAHILRF